MKRARGPGRLARMVGLVLALLGPAHRAGASPGPGPAPSEAYVIVVGYNGGAPGLPVLQYADDDAVRMAVLFSGLYGGDRVWLLADPDADTRATMAGAGIALPAHRPPTRSGLFAALEEVRAAALRRPAGRSAVLYFLYAGHGLEGRFLLSPEGASEAAMTGHELRSALGGLPVDRLLLFFDACRSQTLFTERGGDPEIGPDLMSGISALEARAKALEVGVLTAAASTHPAGETRALRAGYFSHVLASGLVGAADADGDQVISFGELAAFVAFNTERLTGQRPWFAAPDGDLRAPVLDLRGRSPRLELRPERGGRYLVGAGAGTPIFAEAFKATALPLRFFLPPGRYRVTHLREQTGAETADVTLGPGASTTVADGGWTAAVPAPERARGADAAPMLASDSLQVTGFLAPFSSAVVSALAAGYHSGREPMSASAPDRAGPGAGVGGAGLLGALATVGTAPLGLSGAEAGGGLLYLRPLAAPGPLGHLFVGLSAELVTSSHVADGAAYQLRRTQVGVRLGAAWSVLRRLSLGPFALVGWQTVIRSPGDGVRGDLLIREASDRTSGDLFVPSAGVGALGTVALGRRLSLLVEGRYLLRWIDVDGNARLTRDPSLSLGLGWRL